MPSNSRKLHWEEVYQTKPLESVGWYQPKPETSLSLISRLELSSDAAIIDVGGGDSLLTDHLLNLGFEDLSVLDISAAALRRAKKRLGIRSGEVHWLESDILDFEPVRSYALWHDRATFHFLTHPVQIKKYLEIARKAIPHEGFLILGAFSDKGPPTCSGLPVQRYSILELQRVLAPHFDLVHGLNLDHITPSGSVQAYTFGLFQGRG